jgi:hypothetical protein
MRIQDLRALEQYLWPKGFRRDIWMIVDAARDRRIFGMLLNCFYSRRTCLFSGTLAPELEIAAPYLVQLEYEDENTQRFITQAWGKNWGVFLKCDMGLNTLKRHLQELLIVRDSRGNRFLFRFYDPRVLRIYLATCTPDELRTVFGGIERFLMEDDKPETVLNIGFDQVQLDIQKLSLQR